VEENAQLFAGGAGRLHLGREKGLQDAGPPAPSRQERRRIRIQVKDGDFLSLNITRTLAALSANFLKSFNLENIVLCYEK
jgi:hypothetical protein